MDLQLQGKIVMVAASSKGLGYGIARELALDGAMLSIGSRTESEITKTAHKIESEIGVKVLPTVLDSSNKESLNPKLSPNSLA